MEAEVMWVRNVKRASQALFKLHNVHTISKVIMN